MNCPKCKREVCGCKYPPGPAVPALPVRASVVLEAGAARLMVGWRNYAHFRAGRFVGCAMRQSRGAGDAFRAMGCAFYPAGAWENEFIDPAADLFSEIGIKPDVWVVIQGERVE